MSKLREYTLELGCDVSEWPAELIREVVVELYASEPDWLSDAISETGVNTIHVRDIVRILAEPDEMQRQLMLGRLFDDALLKFPLNSLEQKADENFSRWHAQDQTETDDEAFRKKLAVETDPDTFRAACLKKVI